MSIEKSRTTNTLSAKEGGGWRKWVFWGAVLGIGVYATAVNWEAIQAWWGENVIETIADARESISGVAPEVMNGKIAAITASTNSGANMILAA